jgi:hypothetical protein
MDGVKADSTMMLEQSNGDFVRAGDGSVDYLKKSSKVCLFLLQTFSFEQIR